VQERQPAEQIREQACREGMRTLRQSALEAVRSGRTTAAEAIRVTQEDF
jgi:type II secretory ATPase GspE/PulE/Tfp pilus assembly ATPase PilB-like protein